jgi:hypothetical protein
MIHEDSIRGKLSWMAIVGCWMWWSCCERAVALLWPRTIVSAKPVSAYYHYIGNIIRCNLLNQCFLRDILSCILQSLLIAASVVSLKKCKLISQQRYSVGTLISYFVTKYYLRPTSEHVSRNFVVSIIYVLSKCDCSPFSFAVEIAIYIFLTGKAKVVMLRPQLAEDPIYLGNYFGLIAPTSYTRWGADRASHTKLISPITNPIPPWSVTWVNVWLDCRKW